MNALQRGTRLVTPLMLGLAVSVAPAFSAVAAPPVSAAPATSSCSVQWGSLVEQRATSTSDQVTNVRSGRHACFDRLVFDLNGNGKGRVGFHVEYVDEVTQDGSGATVPLRGGARLAIVIKAPAYDDSGNATYRPTHKKNLVDVTGYQTFRQVAWAGTFEGQLTVGLGVRARLPMRTFVLDGPGGGHRVVVDVAHSWS